MQPATNITPVVLSVLLTCIVGVECGAQTQIRLWPDEQMPNSRGMVVSDSVSNERIYQVSRPAMIAYIPPRELNTGVAALIFPGGGYHHLTVEIEGEQLAQWLNTLGVSAFVVTYRLPHSPDLIDRSIGPVQDAQRALRIVRSRADEWGVDPNRIGAMGTSAGGHLAATLGTFEDDVSAIGDSADDWPFSPDFMILISPVIDLGPYGHEGSRRNLLGHAPSAARIERFSLQTRVSARTPPAILFHAADDRSVPAQNSLLFFEQLQENGIPAALHVFDRGGHALLLEPRGHPAAAWKSLSVTWLESLGILIEPEQP